MDLTSLLLSTAIGCAGGYVGSALKKNGLDKTNNLVAGAVGGLILPVILSAVAPPTLLGDLGNNTLVSLLIPFFGGAIGSLIGGLMKKTVS